MTKWEWESELRRNLSRLNATEQERILGYYGELFDDKIEAGLTETQIIQAFGNPRDVAEQIMAGYPYELHAPQAQAVPEKDRPSDMPPPEKEKPRVERADEPEKRGFLGIDFGKRRTFEPSGTVRSLRIRTEGKVSVVRGDAMAIEYCESDYFRYEFTENDGVLEVRYVSERALPSLFFMGLSLCGYDKTALSVTLPRESTFDLDIETKNSKVRVDGGKYGVLSLRSKNAHVGIENLSAATVDVATTNAAVTAHALRGQTGKFTTRNGAVTVSASRFDALDVLTTNAVVGLECVDVVGRLVASSTNGRIKWECVKAADGDASTSNAPIDLVDVRCAKLRAVSTNGALSIEKIQSDDITLKTTNGGIRGTVVGNREDYSVASSTYMGENTLLGGSGPKKITATTTMGSIRIDFVP